VNHTDKEELQPCSRGPQHIAGDTLIEALDALEGGDAAGATDAFGRAWVDAYGVDDVDATITNVMGTFSASL